jgi:hypothetical protein
MKRRNYELSDLALASIYELAIFKNMTKSQAVEHAVMMYTNSINKEIGEDKQANPKKYLKY